MPARCRSNVQPRSRLPLRAVALVVIGLAATALPYSPCWSGQVPDNAQARSLQMRPEFLDDVSLIFLYPQRAGGTSGGLVSFVRDSGVDGLAAIGNAHSNGFFLLTQPGRGVLASTSLVQAGWGVSWNRARFGLAFRGGHEESEDIRRQESPQAPEAFSGESENFTRFEGGFGIGVELDRLELDLEAELTREDITLQFARVDSDTLAASVENTADPFLGTSGRLGIRITPAVEIVAVGSWTDAPRQTLEGLQLVENRVSPVRLEHDFERWSAGLAIRFETSRIDAIWISSHWDRNEFPAFQFQSYVAKQALDTARVGASVQHRFWRELEGRAGLEARYQKSVSELREIRPDLYRSSSTSTTKNVSPQFAWGVSYSWRNFEVRTSVEQTLDLFDLFIALDLIVEL